MMPKTILDRFWEHRFFDIFRHGPEVVARGQGCARNWKTGWLPSEITSKIIIIENRDHWFDWDLTHDNLWQRVTGNTLWRTPGFWDSGPRRRMLRTTWSPPLKARRGGAISFSDLGHLWYRERGCEALSSGELEHFTKSMMCFKVTRNHPGASRIISDHS